MIFAVRKIRHFQALAVLGLAALLLGGCATAMPAAQTAAQPAVTTQPSLPQPEPGKLTVTDVRARPAPLEGGNGAAYFTVLNGLDKAVQLQSVTGDAAKSIELHETTNDNGVMKMEPHPEGFAIPAGAALELKPGGKHVMMVGLSRPLAVGDTISLTLNFDNGEQIALNAPVLEIQAGMPMTGSMPGMDSMPMSTPTP